MALSLIGLDIGRSFIKVVQVKKSGSKLSLESCATVVTPSGGIQSDSPFELKRVSEAIRNCVKAAKSQDDSCAVSLVESQVVTRLIDMPNLTDKELSSAINWEADQYIPLPIRDVNLQYQIISRPDANTSDKMQVLLIAAPKRMVEKYLRVVKDAGLNARALETESSALSRALIKVDDPPSIIISFGAVSTELILVKDGHVVFTRSLATGGVNLTRSIMAEFNMAEAQAEEYKHAYGILEDKLGGKVSNILKPILELVVGEVIKATEFSRSHLANHTIARIIMCGGGAYLPGFTEYLTQRTSLEVLLADPWSNFEKEGLIMRLPGQGSFYSVATGLALRF